MSLPLPCLHPEWPRSPGTRALCSTREGGVSQSAYRSLNLGDHVGDAPDAVAVNRDRFADALGARPVFLKQVHGTRVVRLEHGTLDGVEADGCITTECGIACTIMVADCLPVLFASDDGVVVGAAHAGWRGLAGGVLEAVISAMREVSTRDISAWLGPCIGPEAFEVGDDVRDVFVAIDPQASVHFKPLRAGKWWADLAALARMRLRAAGIVSIHGNDSTRAWCTVSNPSEFFSHRRDRVSGRFAAAVWRA